MSSPSSPRAGRQSEIRRNFGAADRADLARLGRDRAARLTPDADTWSVVYPGCGDGFRLLAERAQYQVQVDGAGRIGAALAVTLAAAGVGTVHVNDELPVSEADVLPGGHDVQHIGISRVVSIHNKVYLHSRPSTGCPLGTDSRVDIDVRDRASGELTAAKLVVVVRDDVIDICLSDQLMRANQPHLAVICAADRVTIGPLVVPGQGPCLRCLDLHRTDRDPAWPYLSAQLATGQRRARPRGEVASSTAAAGIAALHVLGYLDGFTLPASLGRTLDITLPDGIIQARRWSPHPACGCIRL